ncbi:MAG: RNA polymerase sigma factor [Acidimicrobiales bacterium]|jgi:RNA polymerase sigma-70 factor (ECF subfamily)
METDSQLMARAVAGDTEAFGDLVRRHQSVVYRFLARRAGPHDASDLLADVWIAAFRSRHTFDLERESALPWIFGIARNVLRGHWRRSPVETGPDIGSTDPWHQVDERLAAAETTRHLRGPVMALPEEQREVLLLVAWEELSPTQAGEVLGIPASTARSHLRRARLALRPRAEALNDPGV